MTRLWRCAAVGFTCCLMQQALLVAFAQQQWPRVASESDGPATARQTGAADGISSPGLTGKRHPLYRLSKSDVVDISFTFSPEFDHTVRVQPDGYIALKGLNEIYVEGMTMLELRESIREAYAGILHEPVVSIVLKEFDKPYFIASGQITRPGKYELRGDATVTDGLAIAGGFTDQAKHSQVVLFRRISGEQVETRLLDVKQMLKSHNLAEDVHLKPGDMLFVPQNMISKIRRYLPASTVSTYMNPSQF